MARFPGLPTGKTLVLLAVLAIALSGAPSGARNYWTPIGPEGGVVAAMATDPQNPSTVYAATCAGVFKTANGGADWRAVNSGLPEIACDLGPGILAIDPQNTGTVYVLSGSQILKTTDGGARWNTIATLNTDSSLWGILIAPSNPNVLYASDGAGTFKSADGGASWIELSSVAGPVLAVDPQNQDILHANAVGRLSKSTDGGISWNPANSGLPMQEVQVLAIDLHSPDTLYAGDGGQIFKSTDGGASWNPASFGLSSLAPPAGNSNVVSLLINPQNPTLIYALIHNVDAEPGSLSLATSTDGAATWTIATDPNLSAAGLRTITLSPQDSSTVYLGTNNGILKTTDAGAHWNFANSGLRAVGVDSLIADSQTKGTLFAVTDCCPAGIFKSTDGGSSWFPANAGLPPVEIGLTADVGVPVAIPGLVADPQQPGTLYALEVLGGRLFQSQDDGGSWADIWSNTASTAPATHFGPLAIAPQQPNIMYAGVTSCTGSCYNRISKSTDGGHSWTDSQVVLTPLGGGCCGVITSVNVEPQDANTVYVGIGDDQGGEGALWQSTDGGVSWVSLTSVFPPAPAFPGAVDYVTIDPGNPSTIYVGFRGVLPDALKTTDGGQTWVASNLGAGGFIAGPFVLDPQDSATLYSVVYGYATSCYEVLRSTDAGANWTEVGLGLKGSVNSLTIDPQNPATLYAGPSSGLFVLTRETQKLHPAP